MSSFYRILEFKMYGSFSKLNNVILKFNFPLLFNQLGNIFRYCPAVGAIRRIALPILIFKEGQSCSRECLYCDSSQDIQWNIVGISLRLRLYSIVKPFSCHNKVTQFLAKNAKHPKSHSIPNGPSIMSVTSHYHLIKTYNIISGLFIFFIFSLILLLVRL